jgi:hypothetical protein
MQRQIDGDLEATHQDFKMQLVVVGARVDMEALGMEALALSR